MSMLTLRDVTCASIPCQALGALAEVRDLSGVRVALLGEVAWVRWEADDERMLRVVLPVAGATLYCHREGRWYRHGCELPAFGFPARADYRPLPEVVTPSVVRPIPARSSAMQPVSLTLVRDQSPRAVTALYCGVKELVSWAETVPSVRLSKIQAAWGKGKLLLVGSRLPPLVGPERFWGDGVLVPLGFRLEPNLPQTAVREALAVGHRELVLARPTGFEVLPREVFQPLTRGQLHLALLRTQTP